MNVWTKTFARLHSRAHLICQDSPFKKPPGDPKSLSDTKVQEQNKIISFFQNLAVDHKAETYWTCHFQADMEFRLSFYIWFKGTPSSQKVSNHFPPSPHSKTKVRVTVICLCPTSNLTSCNRINTILHVQHMQAASVPFSCFQKIFNYSVLNSQIGWGWGGRLLKVLYTDKEIWPNTVNSWRKLQNV